MSLNVNNEGSDFIRRSLGVPREEGEKVRNSGDPFRKKLMINFTCGGL